MNKDWLSASEALRLASNAIGPRRAASAILRRAHGGMIRARAARLVSSSETFEHTDIPPEFWANSTEPHMIADWQLSDFEALMDEGIYWTAYGVTFDRKGVEELIGAAGTQSLDPSAAPQAGGRPSASWWDDLWVEICRLLYVGDLKPKTQADIETAMMNWTSAHGQTPATSTVRQRASKLWRALRSEDEN